MKGKYNKEVDVLYVSFSDENKNEFRCVYG